MCLGLLLASGEADLPKPPGSPSPTPPPLVHRSGHSPVGVGREATWKGFRIDHHANRLEVPFNCWCLVPVLESKMSPPILPQSTFTAVPDGPEAQTNVLGDN